MKPELIPTMLRERQQWVLWKFAERDGQTTKLPYQTNGKLAKSNDASTWTTLAAALAAVEKYSGIGFVFAADGDLCGIDLDGCRNPETGEVAQWAREVVIALNTYAEVSPTGTGIKLFIVGKLQGAGRKKDVADAPRVCDKTPAIEVYDRGRYFAVTGLRLAGMPHEPQPRQEQLNALLAKYCPAPIPPPVRQEFTSEAAVIDRARRYLAKIPPAIAGQGGHNATFHAACVLVMGFLLGRTDSLQLLSEWNLACQPPWSQRELEHKVADAERQSGERGYLRNVPLDKQASVKVPAYAAPAPKPEPKKTTLIAAARNYLDKVKEGKQHLIELGLGDVDYAIGGGVAPGEMIVMAARPSHGKSAIALQCIHAWTACKRPSLIISEEMSALVLGKRALQFISPFPEEVWREEAESIEENLQIYDEDHELCHIVESVGTAELAVEQIEKHVAEHGVQTVVVDYAQLLRSPGKSRYEQVTNTSILLRQVTSRLGIATIVLAQLNREIERRDKFIPKLSDIKDSGQLEQDADVILFLVWPYKLDNNLPKHEYQVCVAKNRNRAIMTPAVNCRFMPHRQMLVENPPEVKRNTELDQFNERERSF